MSRKRKPKFRAPPLPKGATNSKGDRSNRRNARLLRVWKDLRDIIASNFDEDERR